MRLLIYRFMAWLFRKPKGPGMDLYLAFRVRQSRKRIT